MVAVTNTHTLNQLSLTTEHANSNEKFYNNSADFRYPVVFTVNRRAKAMVLLFWSIHDYSLFKITGLVVL